MQVSLNGFTFIRNNDGTDNIHAVLKKRDKRSLAGIIKDAKHHSTLRRYNMDVVEFILHVLAESVKVQKEPKKSISKKYNPTIYTTGK